MEKTRKALEALVAERGAENGQYVNRMLNRVIERFKLIGVNDEDAAFLVNGMKFLLRTIDNEITYNEARQKRQAAEQDERSIDEILDDCGNTLDELLAEVKSW